MWSDKQEYWQSLQTGQLNILSHELCDLVEDEQFISGGSRISLVTSQDGAQTCYLVDFFLEIA